MRPRYLSTPVTPALAEEDRRAIVNGIAIGVGVAVVTELARFGLEQAKGWLERRRARETGGAS